ncbi:MAG: YkgJ family cysteine cluster protein [Rhizomicrobium sp.]
MAKQHFDCSRCPGYCCSYHIIPVNKTDLKRLAKHFGLSVEEAQKKFVNKGDKKDGGEFKIKRKTDVHFGKICRFFDTDERRCTIYEARMKICRAYPTGRCGYYEFLKIERDTQEDQDMVASTWNVDP